jgi:hypothetical protein
VRSGRGVELRIRRARQSFLRETMKDKRKSIPKPQQAPDPPIGMIGPYKNRDNTCDNPQIRGRSARSYLKSLRYIISPPRSRSHPALPSKSAQTSLQSHPTTNSSYPFPPLLEPQNLLPRRGSRKVNRCSNLVCKIPRLPLLHALTRSIRYELLFACFRDSVVRSHLCLLIRLRVCKHRQRQRAEFRQRLGVGFGFGVCGCWAR